jgi:hypothetical protein
MSDVALVNYRHTGIDQCVYSAYTELDSAIECSLLPLTECCCICVPFGVVQVPKSGLTFTARDPITVIFSIDAEYAKREVLKPKKVRTVQRLNVQPLNVTVKHMILIRCLLVRTVQLCTDLYHLPLLYTTSAVQAITLRMPLCTCTAREYSRCSKSCYCSTILSLYQMYCTH